MTKKFKAKDEHISRERTQTNEISNAWNNAILPLSNKKYCSDCKRHFPILYNGLCEKCLKDKLKEKEVLTK